jgi:hypothetical protein
MEPIILPARVREAEAILKLQYLCYQTEAALYDDSTIAPLTQSLTDQEYQTGMRLASQRRE